MGLVSRDLRNLNVFFALRDEALLNVVGGTVPGTLLKVDLHGLSRGDLSWGYLVDSGGGVGWVVGEGEGIGGYAVVI